MLNEPGQSNLSEELARARSEVMQGNWDAARQALNEAKAKDSKTPYVMSMLGFVAQHQKKPDEAIEDYELELANHPDVNTSIIVDLARLYAAQNATPTPKRCCGDLPAAAKPDAPVVRLFE